MLCDSCGAPLPVGTLVCEHCGRQAVPSGPAARSRGSVPKPAALRITDDGWSYELSWRWFRPVHVFLVFFCVVWDSFLVFWYAMALGGGPPFPFNLIMILFPIAHVAVGVGLTWYTLCGFLNRTVVTVRNHELTVRHEPLPWPGHLTLDAGEIRQFFVREKVSHGKNGTSVTYDVEVVESAGTSRKLVTGLDSAELALAIEQGLEQHLRIVDEGVAGEVSR